MRFSTFLSRSLSCLAIVLVGCSASSSSSDDSVADVAAFTSAQQLCGNRAPILSEDGRSALVTRCAPAGESLARVDLDSGRLDVVVADTPGDWVLVPHGSSGRYFTYQAPDGFHVRDWDLTQDTLIDASSIHLPAPYTARVDEVVVVGERALAFASTSAGGERVATVDIGGASPPSAWAFASTPNELLPAYPSTSIAPGNGLYAPEILASPDGGSALVVSQSTLTRVTFGPGAPRVDVLLRSMPNLYLFAFDGTYAYAVDATKAFTRLDVTTGAVVALGRGARDPSTKDPVFFVTEAGAHGGRTLVRYRGQDRLELGTLDHVDGVTVSPDGRWLYAYVYLPFESGSASAPYEVKLLPTDGSAPPRELAAKVDSFQPTTGDRALLLSATGVDVVDVITGTSLRHGTLPGGQRPELFGIWYPGPNADRVFVLREEPGVYPASTLVLKELLADGTFAMLRSEPGHDAQPIFAGSKVRYYVRQMKLDAFGRLAPSTAALHAL